MINSLLEGNRLREGLDLDTVNTRISEIKSTIYYRARDLYVPAKDIGDIGLEEIIEERRKALEEQKQNQFFLKDKKEYEELLKIKKQLELRRDDKRKEILETLIQKPNIKEIPLKGLINGKTYNGLKNIDINTLGDMVDFIIKHRDKKESKQKRQDILSEKVRKVGRKGIREIEEVLKQYKLLEE
ncbi:MAG: hypothetical protein NTY80_03580 [candidate division SR1 bacterium]|nr:hypothetical protein [candidate division SR1 bacterium]